MRPLRHANKAQEITTHPSDYATGGRSIGIDGLTGYISAVGENCHSMSAKLRVLENNLSSLWSRAVKDAMVERLPDQEVWESLLSSFDEDLTRKHLIDAEALDRLLDSFRAGSLARCSLDDFLSASQFDSSLADRIFKQLVCQFAVRVPGRLAFAVLPDGVATV